MVKWLIKYKSVNNWLKVSFRSDLGKKNTHLKISHKASNIEDAAALKLNQRC